jgi:hypothetical protein
MAAHIVLPWTHRLISNLKRWGLGVYHGLRRTNLQHYLDEFVFRFNRRRTRHAAFDTLLGIGAHTAPTPYHVLIRRRLSATEDYDFPVTLGDFVKCYEVAAKSPLSSGCR